MKTGILPMIYNHRHNDLHEIIAKVLKKIYRQLFFKESNTILVYLTFSGKQIENKQKKHSHLRYIHKSFSR